MILGSDAVVRFLIYKSMIDRYLTQVATKAVSPTSGNAIDKLTLKDLLDWASPEVQLFKNSFGFVSPDATLAGAKQIMDKIPKCGDVFVTQTGKATEPIIGWVTDNLIIENATV